MRTVEDIARILGAKENKLHNIAMIWGFPAQDVLKEVREYTTGCWIDAVYIYKHNPDFTEIVESVAAAEEALDWVTNLLSETEAKIIELSEQEPTKSKLAYYNMVHPKIELLQLRQASQQ